VIFGQDFETETEAPVMTIAHNAQLNRRVTVGRITPLLAGRVP
jgi:hypothetical protein